MPEIHTKLISSLLSFGSQGFSIFVFIFFQLLHISSSTFKQTQALVNWSHDAPCHQEPLVPNNKHGIKLNSTSILMQTAVSHNSPKFDAHHHHKEQMGMY
jgi:hypothetical protein